MSQHNYGYIGPGAGKRNTPWQVPAESEEPPVQAPPSRAEKTSRICLVWSRTIFLLVLMAVICCLAYIFFAYSTAPVGRPNYRGFGAVIFTAYGAPALSIISALFALVGAIAGAMAKKQDANRCWATSFSWCLVLPSSQQLLSG